MLEGEFKGHLGYPKYEQSTTTNTPTDLPKRKLKQVLANLRWQFLEIEILVSILLLVPKRKSMVDGIEYVINALRQRYE